MAPLSGLTPSALRLRQYQQLLQQGPEALARRAAITVDNRAAAQARAAARADRAAPIVDQMRQNQSAVGNDMPRPNPAAAAPDPTPASMPEGGDVYVVDRARAQAILERATVEGWESLLPDELILVEDLREGRARLSDTAESVADLPGDLTDSADETLDNLEPSAIEIGDGPDVQRQASNPNLRVGRSKRETKVEKLRNLIDQYATEGAGQEAASPAFLRGVQKKIDALTEQERAALIASYGDDAEAGRRLSIIAEMAGDARRDPNYGAAKRLAEAADERAASATPRATRQSLLEGVEPGLPAVAARFNQLPDAVKADVIRRLDPQSRAILEAGDGAASISPRALADLMQPVNEVDGLLATIDDGLRNGMNSEAEAARELVRSAPADQRQAAIAAFRRRQAIDAALRTAMTQAEPSPQVLASPGQPSLRRPGAMSPEVAIDEVPAAELPGQFEEALAAQRERADSIEQRSAGGGLDAATRKRMAGLSEEDSLRTAPLYLKGRDGRTTSFESRSRGSRGVESNDLKAMKDYLAAQEQVARASTPGEQAEALAALEKAERELDRKYPRGRKAMSDSRLNSAGQQETYDDLVLAMAGFRPKAESNIARANPSMSAADRALQNDEAVRAFGESDAIELLPDAGEIDDVAELGGSGKPGRLGGTQQLSRRAGAVDQMFSQRFGGQNPLEIPEFGGDPLRVADEILAKNTIFKPGTDNYELARQNIARAISERFNTQRRGLTNAVASDAPAQPAGTTQDVTRVPSEQGSWPEGTMRQSAVVGPNPRDNVQGVSPIVFPGDRPSVNAARTAEDAALESSAVELGDSSPIPEAGAAAGKTPLVESTPVGDAATGGRKLTRDEIEQQAEAAWQEARQQALDEGMSSKQATAAANKRRKQVVAELRAANGPIETKPAADAASPKDKPVEVADSTPVETADSKPAPETPAPAKQKRTRKDGGGGGDPPKGEDPKPTPAPETPVPVKKNRILNLRNVLIAAGLAGAYGLSQMGGGRSAEASSDLPPVPVPPGGGGGVPMEGEEEDALTRALNRIRGSRAGSGEPTTQVLQNWTGRN